ncbi:putative leader peptide [Streptomyces sp. GQFP]|uniref:putative leader peptide n=1 Tax=Streptomyces sp. GQFP TaxID=2907545 RepID=UPI003FA764AE
MPLPGGIMRIAGGWRLRGRLCRFWTGRLTLRVPPGRWVVGCGPVGAGRAVPRAPLGRVAGRRSNRSAHLKPAWWKPGGFHPVDTKWRNTRPRPLVDDVVPKLIPCRPRLYSRRHIDLVRVAGALCCS